MINKLRAKLIDTAKEYLGERIVDHPDWFFVVHHGRPDVSILDVDDGFTVILKAPHPDPDPEAVELCRTMLYFPEDCTEDGVKIGVDRLVADMEDGIEELAEEVSNDD